MTQNVESQAEEPAAVTNAMTATATAATTSFPATEEDKNTPSDQNVSVADLFTLRVPLRESFVCSIACESGLQDVSAADEPLGLVSALLAAGTSSVLATLWPIQSACGRELSRLFYLDVTAQMKVQQRKSIGGKDGTADIKVVNLALAMQRAIVALRRMNKSYKRPYHWAPFVLNGGGFYVYL